MICYVFKIQYSHRFYTSTYIERKVHSIWPNLTEALRYLITQRFYLKFKKKIAFLFVKRLFLLIVVDVDEILFKCKCYCARSRNIVNSLNPFETQSSVV